MMRPRKHNVGPTLIAMIGILVMLAGMAFHFWRPDLYPIEWSVQLIGAAIGFVGFYAMDPKRAKDGAGFLLNAGTEIIGIVRTGGRRSTDTPVVMPPVPTERPADAIDDRTDEIPPPIHPGE